MMAHHKAWLSAHPRRNPGWLSARLADGFEVHHIDGNHANNEPDNLVLIERMDHDRLHGCSWAKLARPSKAQRMINAGPVAYKARLAGLDWAAVAKRLNRKSPHYAWLCASRHATRYGLPLP